MTNKQQENMEERIKRKFYSKFSDKFYPKKLTEIVNEVALIASEQLALNTKQTEDRIVRVIENMQPNHFQPVGGISNMQWIEKSSVINLIKRNHE
jgi:hypothetical protein